MPHTQYMHEALALARLGLGRTSPNPPVGALLVKDGRIVGRGYHHRCGEPHAEVVAIEDAGDDAKGATLYVTLEPCAHYGHTPPCTERIIKSGIIQVIAPTEDPNPQVNGQGFERLRQAGIAVKTGILAEESEELLEAYFHFVKNSRPFVVAKWASSLDGKIAVRSGETRYISGEEAQRFTHKLRNELDAILVGIGTVQADDPQLTCRMEGGRNPLRIILDADAKLISESYIARTSKQVPTILVVSDRVQRTKTKKLEGRGLEVVALSAKDGFLDLLALMKELNNRGLASLLVEGGAKVLGSFFDRGLVDKVYVEIAPIIIGGEEAKVAVTGEGVETLADAWRLDRLKVERLGEDILVSGYVKVN